MKQLKEYLHLYLGCRVCFSRYNSWNETTLTASLLDDYYDGDVEIKPILRHLSDMTEDENNETSALYFSLMEKQNKGNRDIKMMAEMSCWYISKHLDLFGLIDAGLAIDKTTL